MDAYDYWTIQMNETMARSTRPDDTPERILAASTYMTFRDHDLATDLMQWYYDAIA